MIEQCEFRFRGVGKLFSVYKIVSLFWEYREERFIVDHGDPNTTGRIFVGDLQTRNIQLVGLHSSEHPLTQGIAANATDQERIDAKSTLMPGYIEGRPTQHDAAVHELVVEHFPEEQRSTAKTTGLQNHSGVLFDADGRSFGRYLMVIDMPQLYEKSQAQLRHMLR